MTGGSLVTGATGFAGRHLVEQLLESEEAVHAWSNPRGQPAPGQPRVLWRAVDLLDARVVRDEIARVRPSAIYHCAGFADASAATSQPARALRVNALGTLYLLDAVRSAGLQCPVLVTGSALVYRPTSEAMSEDSPIGPASTYGVTKLAQEMIAMRASCSRTHVVRAFNHAGPGQSPAFVTSSFAQQIAEIEGGRRAPLIEVGNLDARRDITDVRDTVRAYRLVVQKGRAQRPYNVCTGRAYRVGDLLDHMLTMCSTAIKVEIDSARLRPADVPIVQGDHSRLSAETGWQPEIPIHQTLSDILEYWRDRIRRH